MTAEEAFITHMNANIALAKKHKETAIALIKQAEMAGNGPALTSAKAAGDRADKARSLFVKALIFQRPTVQTKDYRQSGMEHIDVCERELNKASNLLNQNESKKT